MPQENCDWLPRIFRGANEKGVSSDREFTEFVGELTKQEFYNVRGRIDEEHLQKSDVFISNMTTEIANSLESVISAIRRFESKSFEESEKKFLKLFKDAKISTRNNYC